MLLASNTSRSSLQVASRLRGDRLRVTCDALAAATKTDPSQFGSNPDASRNAAAYKRIRSLHYWITYDLVVVVPHPLSGQYAMFDLVAFALLLGVVVVSASPVVDRTPLVVRELDDVSYDTILEVSCPD